MPVFKGEFQPGCQQPEEIAISRIGDIRRADEISGFGLRYLLGRGPGARAHIVGPLDPTDLSRIRDADSR